jgi:hypothetical protein
LSGNRRECRKNGAFIDEWRRQEHAKHRIFIRPITLRLSPVAPRRGSGGHYVSLHALAL